MFRNSLNKILGKNRILKIKLYLKSITGNYLTNKVLASEQEYIQLFKNCLKNNNLSNFIETNFSKKKIDFINNLALLTQIVKKKSELNFNHGFFLHRYLNNYLNKNKNEKIAILETGTARGFTSIIMASLLYDLKIQSEIHTIDIIPHNKKIFWNCISDPKYGKLSRKSLLKDYEKFLKYITFHKGTSKDVFSKVAFDRINFSFLDSAHDYEDVRFEFNYVKNRNKKGDMIFLYDVTPGSYDGIVKLVNEIKEENLYFITLLDSDPKRGYALLERK